jgi:uncharacterized protein YjiS (DUF1127 family)
MPHVDVLVRTLALPRFAATRDRVRETVHIVGRKVDAWRLAKRRTAQDRDTLASMSDRELLDIGIARGSVRATLDRMWLREYPG